MKPISFDQIWKHLTGAEALKVTSLKGSQVRWEGLVISRSFEAAEDPALDVIKMHIVCEGGEITYPWFHRCDIAKTSFCGLFSNA